MTLEERAADAARKLWDPESIMSNDAQANSPIRALIIGRTLLMNDPESLPAKDRIAAENRFFSRMAEMAHEAAQCIKNGSPIVIPDEINPSWTIRCAPDHSATEKILLQNLRDGDNSIDFADSVCEGTFEVGIVVTWFS